MSTLVDKQPTNWAIKILFLEPCYVHRCAYDNIWQQDTTSSAISKD
jgi:spore maturation protein CgeB